jgi:Ca2+-transporting ATPase
LHWGIRFAIDRTWKQEELIQLVNFFVIGVTVVVVAVPEGLPLAVTISLAFSMFKMIRDNCFVRHLAASETMGQATCICTDKTGTLTENRMTVVKVYTNGKTYNGEGSGDKEATPFSEKTFPHHYRDLLCEAISLNSTCFVKYKPKDPLPVFVGSSTEGALLVMADKFGVKYEEARQQVLKVPNGEVPFSSERKRMAMLVEPRAHSVAGIQSRYRVYVKGASEIVLGLCTSSYDLRLQTASAWSQEKLEETVRLIKEWASLGLRTLVIAYRDFNQLPAFDEESGRYTNLDNNLVFLALVGIKDPIRKEVPLAVAQSQRAGLVVRMVTGDNILTACSIAKECGILNNQGVAMEGPQFRSLSKEEQIKVIPRLQVLARSSPADKFTLVTLLKEMGEVVSVTGDVSLGTVCDAS